MLCAELHYFLRDFNLSDESLQQAREEILKLHSAAMPLSSSCDLSDIAAASHGFSSSDLVAWCREASIAAISRRMLKASDDVEVTVRAISFWGGTYERIFYYHQNMTAHKLRMYQRIKSKKNLG